MYLTKYCMFILVTCLVYLLSSCASTSSLTKQEKEKIGTVLDLVYIEPTENVTYRGFKDETYNPTLGMVGSAIGEGFAEYDTLENRKLLTPYPTSPLFE